MNNNFPNKQLDRLWFERKHEIKGIVRKNFYTYFVLGSTLAFVFLLFSVEMLEVKFPTTAFFWFVGGYFILAVIAHRVVYSEEQEGNKSRKEQYLVLMAWQNLFTFILSLSIMGFAISQWLSFDRIPLPISWLVALMLSSILIFIWWIPRKLSKKMKSYSENESEKKRLSNTRYLWIIGLIILLTKIFNRAVTTDIKNLLLLIFSLSGSIWAISFVIYQFYRDYLLLKNGYLD